MTGRPYIRAEIEKHLAGRMRSVSVGPTKGDIITYLRARLGEDETPDAMDENLEAVILAEIPENISEMCVGHVIKNSISYCWLIGTFRFLLVSLNIDAILQESTIYRRRERLSRMTDGLSLGDAYGATIERIRAQGGDKSRLGMKALMWISHAQRPLKANELCHALAVELDSRSYNVANVPSMSTLLSCSQGLITVDKEESTVRLIHFTLQEYFSAHPDIFSRTHSAIAEVCLAYLNSEHVKAISANRSPNTCSVPNRPGRTAGPWRTIVPGVPGRVGTDGRAKRPSFIKTAVLWVDGRALQSYWERDLPAGPSRHLDGLTSPTGPRRHLQGPAVIYRARPSPIAPARFLSGL